MNNKVLIALPAKDEEKKLGPVLDQIRRYFPGDRHPHRRRREHGPDVRGRPGPRRARLFRHDRNYGYARALQSAREYRPGPRLRFPRPVRRGRPARAPGYRPDHRGLGRRGGGLCHRLPRPGQRPPRRPVHPQVRPAALFLRRQPAFLPRFRTRITDSSSGFKGWNRRVDDSPVGDLHDDNKLHDGRINDLEELFIMARRKVSRSSRSRAGSTRGPTTSRGSTAITASREARSGSRTWLCLVLARALLPDRVPEYLR